MNQFFVTVKHDSGKIRFHVPADTQEAAINLVMKAENCPRCAIVKVRPETMNSRLYRIAYQFLKLRATQASQTAESFLMKQADQDREKLIKFLSFNHNVKFI